MQMEEKDLIKTVFSKPGQYQGQMVLLVGGGAFGTLPTPSLVFTPKINKFNSTNNLALVAAFPMPVNIKMCSVMVSLA